MKRALLRMVVIAAVAAAPLALAGGCSQVGEDVPSLVGLTTPTDNAKAQQMRSAEALYSCLIAADLPASLKQVESSEAVVQFDGHAYSYLLPGWKEGETAGDMGDNGHLDDPINLTTWQMAASANSEAVLVVDGANHTDEFVSCLEKSKYTAPLEERDPAEEVQAKQPVFDATIRWATCARQNGLLSIEDPSPVVADNWATTPMVTLPVTTTPELFDAVLDACPNFDCPAQWLTDTTKSYEIDEDAVPVAPEIRFPDAPPGQETQFSPIQDALLALIYQDTDTYQARYHEGITQAEACQGLHGQQ